MAAQRIEAHARRLVLPRPECHSRIERDHDVVRLRRVLLPRRYNDDPLEPLGVEMPLPRFRPVLLVYGSLANVRRNRRTP